MNKFLSSALASLASILFLAVLSSAAELSLIEKRLIELDKLNKQAILHDSKNSHNSPIGMEEEKSNPPEETGKNDEAGVKENASLDQKPAPAL